MIFAVAEWDAVRSLCMRDDGCGGMNRSPALNGMFLPSLVMDTKICLCLRSRHSSASVNISYISVNDEKRTKKTIRRTKIAVF